MLVYIIISGERRKQADLDKILYKDSLTDGLSYAKFCVDVKKQLVKGKKAAYVVMDLDNFKLINDYYSYEQGNNTIKFIHATWKSILKDNEFVGRIAADRFAIYMRCNSETELRSRLEDFCAKLNDQDTGSMSDYILTPSIGVYLIEEKNTNIQQMQNSAVMAKALVKGDSDSLISFYNENLKKKMTQRKLFVDELIHAIENRELSVVFQPQFSTIDDKLCGA
jgi:diguanylate cyclase (GGDEF)-like protein